MVGGREGAEAEGFDQKWVEGVKGRTTDLVTLEPEVERLVPTCTKSYGHSPASLPIDCVCSFTQSFLQSFNRAPLNKSK
jgi:hypothetical protein